MQFNSRHHFSVVLTLGLSACGYYPKEDGERMRNEVFALQTQMTAMQAALADLQKETRRQTDQVGTLNKEVSTLNQSARRNDADLGVQLDESLQQVARMKGLVEASTDRLATLESAVQKVQEELDVRFTNMQEQARVDQLKNQEEKDKAIATAKKSERLLTEPSQLFKEVERMISSGSPAEARKLLREFGVRAKSERGLQKHLDDATYLIGETYFAEENFQQAAAEYNNVRKNHPKSPRVPEALFRLGNCFERLKLPDDAKLFYQTVREKFPKSKVAKDAKTRLDSLK